MNGLPGPSGRCPTCTAVLPGTPGTPAPDHHDGSGADCAGGDLEPLRPQPGRHPAAGRITLSARQPNLSAGGRSRSRTHTKET